jgi:chromosomal replication initiator protein
MITPTAILEAVAAYYGLEIRALRGPRRWAHYAKARAVGMYLTRDLVGTSYPKIGAFYGGRDHTTAIAAYWKVVGWIADQEPVAGDILELRAKLAGAPVGAVAA